MRTRTVFDYWISFWVRRKVVFTPKMSRLGMDGVRVTEYFLGYFPITKKYTSYSNYFKSEDYKKESLNERTSPAS